MSNEEIPYLTLTSSQDAKVQARIAREPVLRLEVVLTVSGREWRVGRTLADVSQAEVSTRLAELNLELKDVVQLALQGVTFTTASRILNQITREENGHTPFIHTTRLRTGANGRPASKKPAPCAEPKAAQDDLDDLDMPDALSRLLEE